MIVVKPKEKQLHLDQSQQIPQLKQHIEPVIIEIKYMLVLVFYFVHWWREIFKPLTDRAYLSYSKAVLHSFRHLFIALKSSKLMCS